MENVLFCRLCAHKKERYVDIYDEEGHKLSIENKINKCLQIEVYQTDSLPKSVCVDCCIKLDQFNLFMDSSTTAQATLLRLFQDDGRLKTNMDTGGNHMQLTTLDCNSGYQVDKQYNPSHHQLPENIQHLHHEPEDIVTGSNCSSGDIYGESEIIQENVNGLGTEGYQSIEPIGNDIPSHNGSSLNDDSSIHGYVECLVNDKDNLSKRKRNMPIRCYTSSAQDAIKAKRKVTRRRSNRTLNGVNELKQTSDSIDLHALQTSRVVAHPTHIASIDQSHVQYSNTITNSSEEITSSIEYTEECKVEEYTEYINTSNENDFVSNNSDSVKIENNRNLLALNDDSDVNVNKISDNSVIFKDITSWPCTDCSEEFPDVHSLREHHTVVHKQAPRYMCGQCSDVYTQFHCFYMHLRRHKNASKYSCLECGKGFSNRKVLDLHLTTHSDSRPYVCDVCGKGFRQQTALCIHSRCHLPEEAKNKFSCDQCDKKFSTKPNLVTHKRIHSGVRNFTCDQCGKSFIQKGNLDAHLLTHSQDKPFSCHLCNKGFKTAMQLRKHQSVHTGAKPHACDICGRTFRERGTLREHHRIHTGAMPFTCEFCGKSFRFKGILTTHRRQHTGERPYSCVQCQHHFTNWPNYNKHMKRRHGINTSRNTRVKLTTPEMGEPVSGDNANMVTGDSQPAMYEDSMSNNGPTEDLSERMQQHNNASHFYQPAINVMTSQMASAYHVSPPANAMLSFYNLTHIQTLDHNGSAVSISSPSIDVIHPVSQVVQRR